MLRWITLCLCLLALPAHATGGALSNATTGVAGIYTIQLRISDHPHHVLLGYVIVVTRNGHVARALVIRHRRDGVHRLRIAEAWAEGARLAWRRDTGQGCTHGQCRDGPVGRILLTAALFQQAQADGLHARLVGPDGAIDITVPADLFRAAAHQAMELQHRATRAPP
jgi:hypothetical protein